MLTRSRRAASVSMTALMLGLALWIVPAPLALAKGGGGGGGGHGGGGGGGHGGGHSSGHSGGDHSSGHGSGAYHRGGQHSGYYGYWPGYYGGYGYGSYPGYGYGSYGTGYSYAYGNGGYSYPTYGISQGTVAPGPAAYASPERLLGIDELAVDDGGVPGMQVAQVYPGSPAELAGLQVGDVIHAANGYLTQEHGNLTWIISGLPADGVLQMTVRAARDGMERAIDARIP